MTTRVRAALLIGAVALAFSPASSDARTGDMPGAGERGSDAVLAQERRGERRDRDNGGLLDGLGLDSLADIPWDAFALGIALSALVGAGGGFIYAGLTQPKESDEA